MLPRTPELTALLVRTTKENAFDAVVRRCLRFHREARIPTNLTSLAHIKNAVFLVHSTYAFIVTKIDMSICKSSVRYNEWEICKRFTNKACVADSKKYMFCDMGVVRRTDVSEEHIASVFRVTRL
jgi:hypothetical protein